MSINLLDLAKGYLTKEVVGQAASFIGEDQATTQKGFNAILPSLLGGLAGKADDRSAVSDLFNIVSKPEFGGGLLNNVGGLFSNSDTSSSALNLGGSLLNSFFGNKTNGMIDVISNVAGLKSGSASTLTKLALPILMSVIGKKVKSDGLGLDGFINLMKGQQQVAKKAAPAGLLDKLGALGLGAFGAGTAAVKGAGNVASNTVNAASNTVKNTATSTANTVKKTTSSNNNKGGGFGKFLPILLVIGALLAALWFMKGCKKDGVKGGVENVVKKTGEAGGAVVDGAKKAGGAVVDGVEDLGDAVYTGGKELVGKTAKGFENLGAFMSKKLKDGTELIIPSKGGEAKLIDFIESNKKVSDDKTQGWFDLRRVLFETGSANLDVRANNQIENIASILKAYPNVHLKIGGYTDNTGDAANNVKLSDARANAVVNKLVELGIAKDRLSAEGYGEAHPVASNDTEEGRQLNRRVAAKVTKK